jgi:PAS domain S-box-containing protein
MSDLPGGAQAEPRLTPEYVAALVFAESKTMAEATPRVLQAICEELGWDFGALWMIEGASDVLRCVETWQRSTISLSEFDVSTRGATFRSGVGLPGRVWASGQPAWIPDVLADANFPRAPIADHEGLHAAFALPLVKHGTVVGVMEFFSRAIREPDGPLLAMLARVGEQICGFMERKKADEELDRFFALSLDLMCVAGFDGYFKRLNPVWERVLGYTREELLARPYLDFVHPDDRHPTASEAGRLTVGGEVLAFENRYLGKDGRYRWLEWTAVPYPDEQVVYAAARDVTERKEAKETIARYSRDLKAAREAEAANASRLSRLMNELEVRDLLNVVKSALQASSAPQTIDVMSAVPKWVELQVPCTREAAEEIHQVVARLSADLPEDVLDSVSYAFRELLLNAVEWGGKLDPNRHVRIACVRTDRVLIYRIADPGQGFTFSELAHAAVAHVDDPMGHVRVREEKQLRPGGFGILTARANIDELVYNEKQNEVIFMKYLDRPNDAGR